MSNFRLVDGGGGSFRLIDGGTDKRLIDGAIAGVPDAPTIGTATRGDTQATVTFVPPANPGDSAIIEYEALASTSESQTGAGSPITVTAMTNGVAATLKVRARNTQGWGAYSANSNSVTPAGLPAAPTVVLTSNLDQVTATITPGSDNGSAITYATVTFSDAQVAGGPGQGTGPFTITAAYDVSITATATNTNAVGTSAASATSNSVTPIEAYWLNDCSSFAKFTNITTTPNLWSVVGGKLVPGSDGVCLCVFEETNDECVHSIKPRGGFTIASPTAVGGYLAVVHKFHQRAGTNYIFGMWRKGAVTGTYELFKNVNGTDSSIAVAVTSARLGTFLEPVFGPGTVALYDSGVEVIAPVADPFPNICGTVGLRSNTGSTGTADDLSVRDNGVGVSSLSIGYVEDTEFNVGIALNGPASLQLEWSTDSGLAGSTLTAAVAVSAAPYTASFRVADGVVNNTQYYVAAVIDGVRQHIAPFPKVKTARTAAGVRKVMFGACHFAFDVLASGAATGLQINDKIFDVVVARAPEMFFHLGDEGYAGSRFPAPTTLAHWQSQFRQIMAARSRTAGYAMMGLEVPQAVMGSNHDKFADGSATLAVDPNADQAMFDEYFAAHFKPYRAGVRYGVITLGDTEFFLTDAFTYASAYDAVDNASKTYLGAQQKQDWKDWIYTSTAVWKNTLFESSFDPYAQALSAARALGTAYTTERNEMVSFVKSQRISGVLMQAGDNHWSGLFDAPLFCLSHGPLHNGNIAIPVAAVGHANTIYEEDGIQRVVTLATYDTSAVPPTVQFDLLQDDNTVVVGKTAIRTLTQVDALLDLAAPPDTLTNITVTVIGPGKVRVTGTLGWNNGAAITEVRAISTPGSVTGTNSSITSQTGTVSVIVENLDLETEYTFTLRATNSAGNSAESTTSAAVTPAAGGVGGTGLSEDTGISGSEVGISSLEGISA